MNCIIPNANLRVMSKAIQALAKISDELHIEAQETNLSFISTNTTKTVFAKFIFQNSFFSSFNVQETDSQEKISCKIPMKSILKIFKFKPQKEKKIELCKIELKPDVTKIVFKLRYKHDINVVHQLNLIDLETLSISYNNANTFSTIMGLGSSFIRILSNFQISDMEISAEILKDKTIIRNYDASAVNVQKGVRSQITLASSEFLNYDIKNETNLTFSLKPFRSAIYFADTFNLHITWQIETGGRPTVLSMRNPTFDVEYIVATANIDGTSQSSLTTVTNKLDSNTENNDGDWEMNNENNAASFNKILNNLIENFNEQDNNDKLAGVLRPKLREPLANEEANLIFGRCWEPTFNKSMFLKEKGGRILAPNSDSESD